MIWRLHVGPIARTAHGRCAEPLPAAVHVNEWGHPSIGPIPADRLVPARRAALDCPALALRPEREE